MTATTEIATRADAMSSERIELLKRTICSGATNDELTLFVEAANRLRLDPFARQIFAVKRWEKNQNREVMAIQVSIDGFRLVAERTGKYAGQLGPFWTADGKEWTEVWLDHKNPPAAAKVAVLRSDFKEPLWAVATWEQYKQTKKDGGLTMMWLRMGPLMLAKCAESLALRRAFPNELSGVYTQEEMAQATPAEPEYTPPESRAEGKASAPAPLTSVAVTGAQPVASRGAAATTTGKTASVAAQAAPVTTAPTRTAGKPPLPSADKVKHCGIPISEAQLKKLHIMRREAGGSYCTDEGDEKSLWRMKVLGVYRDQQGNRLTSSKQLCKEQASHLIERLTRYMETTRATAEKLPDLGAMHPPSNDNDIKSAIKSEGLTQDDVIEYVLAPYGCDSVDQLAPEDKPGALQLLMSIQQGKEKYIATLRGLGFPAEHIQ